MLFLFSVFFLCFLCRQNGEFVFEVRVCNASQTANCAVYATDNFAFSACHSVECSVLVKFTATLSTCYREVISRCFENFFEHIV